MSEQVQRSRGRSKNYKMDRGGVPAEFGPFYGIVKNTNDSIRSGRIQVYITAFSDGSEDDESKWTIVNYMPQFFGSTPYNPAAQGVGKYIDGNGGGQPFFASGKGKNAKGIAEVLENAVSFVK